MPIRFDKLIEEFSGRNFWGDLDHDPFVQILNLGVVSGFIFNDARERESMLAILSPAKSLNTDLTAGRSKITSPQFLEQASELAEMMRGLSPSDLAVLTPHDSRNGVLIISLTIFCRQFMHLMATSTRDSTSKRWKLMRLTGCLKVFEFYLACTGY